ncbi:MAG: LptF/LptG family permease, partial [Candidatus Margulisbacteria bacterium]|nr:LptF/LptG family permease [Candidatus Margulisiibacteriota bacterium]
MVKLFDRYCIKELTFPFLIATTAFVIIGLVDLLFSLLDYLINRGVPAGVIFKLLLYKVPAIIVLFLPLATLFAVMLVIFRWVKDSEMIVYWTNGVVYERIFVPVVIFALTITGLAFYLGEYVVPITNFKSNTLIHRVILKETIPTLEENTFFKDVGNKIFYVRKIYKDKKMMEGIMLYELDVQPPRVIMADKAQWNGNYWLLQNGQIHRYNINGFFEYEAQFKEMKIKVNYDIDSAYQKVKNTKEMSLVELKKRIREMDVAG